MFLIVVLAFNLLYVTCYYRFRKSELCLIKPTSPMWKLVLLRSFKDRKEEWLLSPPSGAARNSCSSMHSSNWVFWKIPRFVLIFHKITVNVLGVRDFWTWSIYINSDPLRADSSFYVQWALNCFKVLSQASYCILYIFVCMAWQLKLLGFRWLIVLITPLFLFYFQRFNVAITRAQALLIVVGNPHVLCKDRHWNR